MKPRNNATSAFDGLQPPNHTQIPNALLDELMPMMECSELKVTLAICRQTFGWHKKEDELSLSQLKSMTGLSRQSVITGIEDGMKRGVIRRRPKGQSYMYRIQLVQPLDQSSEKNGTEPQKEPQLVQSLDRTSPTIRPVDGATSPTIRPELVQPLDTQKKGKKESESPPPTPPHDSRSNGGDDDFYRELRRRGVGQTKARQIASMGGDPTRTLALIDNRPNASDPNSLGRMINDIIDGVAGDIVRARAVAAPITATRPNLPETIVSPAELARQIRERR